MAEVWGEMRIIAFVTDRPALRAIHLAHLGKPMAPPDRARAGSATAGGRRCELVNPSPQAHPSPA